jgi:predicted protein tyrosine phosphatase
MPSTAIAAPSPLPPDTRRGVPSFFEVRRETEIALEDLNRRMGRSAPPPEADAALDQVERLSARLAPDNSVKTRYEMRQALWQLRQAYGDAPLGLRRSFERLRAVCLDNTWERSLRACPRQRYGIRPRMSQVANFDRVDGRILRGSLPTQEGADWLVGPGRVRAVVDLTVAETDAPWAPVEWANVRHYRVPVKDFTAPSYEQMTEIIDLLDHPPQNGNVYIHCKAGIGRTGVAIACWRVAHGASPDEAVRAEALNGYDANLSQAQAVFDFAERWQREHDKGLAGARAEQAAS